MVCVQVAKQSRDCESSPQAPDRAERCCRDSLQKIILTVAGGLFPTVI